MKKVAMLDKVVMQERVEMLEKFNLALLKSVLLDPTNTIFIDPNHEINMTSLENVLYPSLLNGPQDHHSYLVKTSFYSPKALLNLARV